MYTTIDFDKYNVPAQHSLGMDKEAAAMGLGDAIKNTAVTALTGKAIDDVWGAVDKGLLKRVGTPDAKGKLAQGLVTAEEQALARRKLKATGGAALGYGAYKAVSNPNVRKAVRDKVMRAMGKNPNKNRDMALAAAGTLGAGAAAYGVAKHRQQQKANENFDRTYGYGDYYGHGTRKHASVNEAFEAGYLDACADFEKQAAAGGFFQGAKDFFMYPARQAWRSVQAVMNNPKTFWSNARRRANFLAKGPKVNPAGAAGGIGQAWNSMSNNAKWMTGAGIAGLGAAAYHRGASESRTFRIR